MCPPFLFVGTNNCVGGGSVSGWQISTDKGGQGERITQQPEETFQNCLFERKVQLIFGGSRQSAWDVGWGTTSHQGLGNGEVVSLLLDLNPFLKVQEAAIVLAYHFPQDPTRL